MPSKTPSPYRNPWSQSETTAASGPTISPSRQIASERMRSRSARSSGMSSHATGPMRPVALLDSPPATAELVVVGAGVIGAATAHAARRAGLDAVVVEAKPAVASATTAVATGAYRLQQDDPDELVLVRETVAAMHDFAA